MGKFMKTAVEEAFIGVRKKEGGPFGAVIVKGGRIISKAHNRVVKTKDPTAHAEIMAIRKASKKLKSFDLSGCEIYSTCEPCPMCLAAIYWARIRKVYYGCKKNDAAKIGFDDKVIYDVMKGSAKKKDIDLKRIERKLCLKPMKEWEKKSDKVMY